MPLRRFGTHLVEHVLDAGAKQLSAFKPLGNLGLLDETFGKGIKGAGARQMETSLAQPLTAELFGKQTDELAADIHAHSLERAGVHAAIAVRAHIVEHDEVAQHLDVLGVGERSAGVHGRESGRDTRLHRSPQGLGGRRVERHEVLGRAARPGALQLLAAFRVPHVEGQYLLAAGLRPRHGELLDEDLGDEMLPGYVSCLHPPDSAKCPVCGPRPCRCSPTAATSLASMTP